jgi:hypothetical protein
MAPKRKSGSKTHKLQVSEIGNMYFSPKHYRVTKSGGRGKLNGWSM